MVNSKHDLYYLKCGIKTLQPYVVFCGELKNLSCCHVVLDKNIIYNVDTPINAIDITFKLFFSLKLEFPIACKHIWSFLQKYVYDMKEKSMVAQKLISELIVKLNQLNYVENNEP